MHAGGMDDDGDRHWARHLLVGLLALLAVAVVIGGVVSAFALGAARVSGIDDSGAAEPSVEPSLVLPSGTPTTAPPSSTPADPSPSATRKPSRSPAAKKSPVSLQVYPGAVPPNGRINLTGAYPRAEGAQLQVQRFEGRWVDFPVTASVEAGRFSTFVQSAKTGVLRFRVIDKAAGHASNEVRIAVG